MISTKITLSCNNKECKKTHVVEGANATRAQLYKASKKDGWQWKNAEVQFCPAHKTVKAVKVAKVKAAKPVSKAAVVAKASAKKAYPAKAKNASPKNAKPASVSPVAKPSPVWNPSGNSDAGADQ